VDVQKARTQTGIHLKRAGEERSGAAGDVRDDRRRHFGESLSYEGRTERRNEEDRACVGHDHPGRSGDDKPARLDQGSEPVTD